MANELEKKEEKTVNNKKIYITICICLIMVITIILVVIFLNKKMEKEPHKEDNKSEEKVEVKEENENSDFEEQEPIEGIDIGKLKDIVSFGVISIDEFTKGTEAGQKISRIVAYTSENKVINIYTLNEEYFKKIVEQKGLGYTPVINDIDYSDGKLYILIHDEVFYIDLSSNDEYKLESINYKLESPYYNITVLDNVIYFGGILTNDNFKYDINTKKTEKFSEKMTKFIIKKDTKEIVYVLGDLSNPYGGNTIYRAPINNIENDSKQIYNSQNNIFEYISYDSKNLYFVESPQDINNPSYFVTCNITLNTCEKEEYIENYDEDTKIGNQTIKIERDVWVDENQTDDIYIVLDENGNKSNLVMYEVDGNKIEIPLSDYSSYWYDLAIVEKKVVIR